MYNSFVQDFRNSICYDSRFSNLSSNSDTPTDDQQYIYRGDSKVTLYLKIRDTMNAEGYLTMLQDEIWPDIHTWLNTEDLIFMQDGSPPHFGIVVCEWLNTHFPRRWMGCSWSA